jgi:hypothetical protein
MAPLPTPEPAPDEAPALAKGQVARYPVEDPHSGGVRHQLVLVVSDPDPDDGGAVRAWPLGYEDQAARILPDQFAR